MNQTLTQSKRITSIDLLRGLVMIIMALDHVRDYFHWGAFQFDPLDLQKTDGLLFFTRWITHFCAPVFMFLAGTSAFITGQRKTKKELSLFLLKRGIWLVILELTIINLAWNFDIAFHSIYFIVIWVLGISMIFLAGLIYLPKSLILVFGFLLVAGHNLLDNINVNGNNINAFGWALLHKQNLFNWQGRNVLVGYPIIPWVGIMALGYCFGTLYSSAFSQEKRKKYLLIIGCIATALFIVIRLINVYGDPFPWSRQPSSFYTFLSFIKTNKYPPSLLYTLMTLGPAILFLALTEKVINSLTKFISIYGRVPMFYYILHIFLIHLLAILAAGLFTDFNWRIWILDQPIWLADMRGYGFSLSVVYLVWAIVVIGLYPLCKWYDKYKTNHKEKWWLSYL